ncbi:MULTISPECIES: thiamine phosphate synthase [Reichenbachiella]|uniref:thiamine phosphate synthase n=1 Tax=Reichenbachiella TaxID=156993 RepID=UPI000E6BA07F|nr:MULTISPECIES: thiamine phosphate synthase [Reichenbachiella]MBU2916262.1 thiamine phosphate synthase [Reichenbachiella agariperforans]RJE75108.1 hypothetical protein BGP76_18540 [Reichenbachiella sp. MSK19-1]
MKIVIITPETLVDQELETCNELLQHDVRLHIRKPHGSKDELTRYLDQIDPLHYEKISLHQHHSLVEELKLGGKHWKSDQIIDNQCLTIRSKSFHNWEDLVQETAAIDYGFLSPIYDSISKRGYTSGFDETKLKKWVTHSKPFPVYALGGVTFDKLEALQDLGFDGAALLGAFWNLSDIKLRLKTLKQITHGNSKR